MKKSFTLLTLLMIFSFIANAQYYYLYHQDEGNPNGVVTEDDNLVGTGWTTLLGPSVALPKYSKATKLPFAFNFNGNPVEYYKASSTGYITFDTAATAAATSTNEVLPSALIPDNSILVWGLTASGSNDLVRVKTVGTAPNRQYWIEYLSCSTPGNTTSFNYMSIVLEETSNRIYVVDQYRGASSGSFVSPKYTIGIQIDNTTAYQVAGSPNINPGANGTSAADNDFYEFIMGVQPDNDAYLKSVNLERFVRPGSHQYVSGRVLNYGKLPITSIALNYDVNGTVYTVNKTVNVASGGIYDFTHNTLLETTDPGQYAIKVWVSVPGDVLNENDTISGLVDVVAFESVKRFVFEEGTGTWCGWCPRGAVFMDSLHALYPERALLVAVHNGDPMTVTAYDSGIGAKISGYPSGLVDRKGGEADPSEFITQYIQREQNVAICDVNLNTTYDETSRNLTIDVSSHFAVSLQGDYRFNAVIVEDGVRGTSSGYNQTNYYSFQSQNIPLVGAGHNWQAEPASVPASRMVYDHVGRAILGGFAGTASSLPATIAANDTHTYTYNYTLPANFNASNVHVIAWVSDAVTGEIVNGNQSDKIATSAVGVKKNDVFALNVFPNPFNKEISIDVDLKNAESVMIEVYDMMGRKVYAADKGLLSQGLNTITWTADDAIPAGMYNLVVRAGGESTTQKIVLNK